MGGPEGRREDVVYPLAQFIASTGYDDIPRQAVEMTKNCILDTLGVILPASDGSVPGCREFVGLIIESSGVRESTILQFGVKVPAWLAAFANSGMAHALDYDDIYSRAVIHPSCMVVPAAFAAAERRGRVSGKELVVAVTLGNELTCRMGLTIDWRHDWHLTPLFGRFGCAAAAGKLMGFGVDALVSAFGIGLNEAPGSLEVNRDPECTLRAFEFGFAARGGVLAAQLAERGITGPRGLERGVSLFPVYFQGQEYDRTQLLSELGDRYEVLKLGFKPWPSCALTHSYIGALLDLIVKHDIRPEQIEEIVVPVNQVSGTLFEPIEVRRKPPNSIGAKYSLPFTLSVAALKRRVGIADYSPAGLADPDVLDLARKVVPRLEQSVRMVGGVTQGMVEVTTKEGKTCAGSVDIAKGRPENPMSRADLIEKFRDCARHAAKPITRERVDRVVDMVMGIEEVDDVSAIVAMLA